MDWIGYFGIYCIPLFLFFSGFARWTSKFEIGDFFSQSCTSVIKGLAILLVVCCHYMGSFGNGVVFFTPLGGIGVAIFLVLSGYGLNESWNKKEVPYKGWWRKRIVTVVFPYFVIQCLLYWPFHTFSVWDFVLDVLFIKPKYAHGWYLSNLIMWYAIFYIVRRITLINKYRIHVFLIISIISFLLLSEIRAEQSLSFFTGVFLSEHKNDLRIKKWFQWKGGSILILIGAFALGVKQFDLIRSGPQIIFNLIQLMIKLPCGLGIMLIIWELGKHMNLRFFNLIGIVSYEIYITHGYVLGAVTHTYTQAVLFVFGMLALSVIFWWLMNKVKPLLMKILQIV